MQVGMRMHRDGVGITMGLFTSFNMNYFIMD